MESHSHVKVTPLRSERGSAYQISLDSAPVSEVNSLLQEAITDFCWACIHARAHIYTNILSKYWTKRALSVFNMRNQLNQWAMQLLKVADNGLGGTQQNRATHKRRKALTFFSIKYWLHECMWAGVDWVCSCYNTDYYIHIYSILTWTHYYYKLDMLRSVWADNWMSIVVTMKCRFRPHLHSFVW